MNEEVLGEILRESMKKHQNEWLDKKEEVLKNLEKLRMLVRKDEILEEDLESLYDEPLKQLKILLGKDIIWLWGGIDARVDEILSRPSFKDLLLTAEDVITASEAEKLSEIMLNVIFKGRHTKLATVTCWLCVMNPKVFFPLNHYVLPRTLLEKLELKITWGGTSKRKTIESVREYFEFLKTLERINKRLGIETMIEAAFYLSRFRDLEENGEKLSDEQNQSESQENITLEAYLTRKGYLYPKHLISQFYTALKTKGFVILSGLTGTGKTKIVQKLAELLDSSKKNFLFLSVRPDWRDSKPLLGYYNPLTGEYHKTSLLNFILKAIEDYEDDRDEATPYFVLLDEMNLAHVEYYFADFLSVLESGRDEDGFTRESIKLHDVDKVVEEQDIPKEIKLPPNLYIIGTVNMDETTYSFSPKVLDRAFVVEFHDVELEEYPPEKTELTWEEIEKLRKRVLKDFRREGKFLAVYKREKDKREGYKKGKDESEKGDIEKALNELKKEYKEYWEILKQLNKALEPYDMHFGYRVVDEIALFFQNANKSWKNGIVEFENEDEIFDLALLMKILPKFHGNRKKLKKPLKAILVECLRRENNTPVKFRVSFTEGANTRTLEIPTDIDNLSGEAIIEMLANWEKYRDNFRFKHTARKVLRMLRQLYEIGFASFS